MEGFGKTAVLILVVAAVSTSSGLEIGGSVCYSSLAGDFGRDYTGGIGFSAVLRRGLSTTHDLALLGSARKFVGRENEELDLWLRTLALRFRLFPVEEKPYFLAYSVSLLNVERSLQDHFERASYPGFGLGGGVALPVGNDVELTLSFDLCRILAKSKSGSLFSIDAQFARHL